MTYCSSLNSYFLFDVHINLACVYTYPMCLLGTCRGQKRALDPLEMESLMILSYYVRGQNPGSLQDQQAILNSEPTLLLPSFLNTLLKKVIYLMYIGDSPARMSV